LPHKRRRGRLRLHSRPGPAQQCQALHCHPSGKVGRDVQNSCCTEHEWWSAQRHRGYHPQQTGHTDPRWQAGGGRAGASPPHSTSQQHSIFECHCHSGRGTGSGSCQCRRCQWPGAGANTPLHLRALPAALVLCAPAYLTVALQVPWGLSQSDLFNKMAGPAPPPFSINGCRHDMSTYWGRVSHFFDLTDLRNATLSARDIQNAQSLLESYKSKTLPVGVTDAQLWEAKKSASFFLEGILISLSGVLRWRTPSIFPTFFPPSPSTKPPHLQPLPHCVRALCLGAQGWSLRSTPTRAR
jgi:hypothetical protein